MVLTILVKEMPNSVIPVKKAQFLKEVVERMQKFRKFCIKEANSFTRCRQNFVSVSKTAKFVILPFSNSAGIV